MYVKTGTIAFPKKKGSGPQQLVASVTFPRAVSEAYVVMTSFEGGFSPRSDHEFGQMDIKLGVKTVTGQVVTVVGTLGVRDWSAEWNDYYQGSIGFAVLAHLT